MKSVVGPGLASCWFASLLVLLACGGRTGLQIDGDETSGGGVDAVGGSGPGGSMGVGGAGGTGGGIGGDPVLPPCLFGYASAGEPVVAVSLENKHAVSPTVVTTNADPDAGPLEVAIQYIASGGSGPHDSNGMTRVEVGADWPDVTLGSRTTVGIESHSYGLHVTSTSGERMALVWFSDAGGVGRVAFRTVDVAKNTLGPVVDIEAGAFSAMGLSAGAALDTNNTSHVGEGYGVTWSRNLGGARQRVMSVLDDEGRILTGPHPVTPELSSLVASDSVWTGTHYVFATGFREACPPNEPLCEPNALVLTRFRTASGDENDDSGIDVVASFGPSVDGGRPRRPELVHHDGRTWLIWAEESAMATRSLRAVELAQDGTPLDVPAFWDTVPSTSSHVTAHASDQGLALAWLEPNPAGGPPDEPGAGWLHLRSFSLDGVRGDDTDRLPITRFQGSAVAVASLGGADQRSLVVTWSGQPAGTGLDVAYVTRFDCVLPSE